MKTFSVGDRVAYSAAFCRSTGQITGDVPAGRGTVTEIVPLGSITLAAIAWDGDADLPARVAVNNLAHVGPNRRFAHVD